MKYADPVVCLDSPLERENTIRAMIASLRFSIMSGTLDAAEKRGCETLIELMPQYLRFLDRERVAFIEKMKTAKQGNDPSPLDEFLSSVTLPLVNMLGAALMTVMPQPKVEDGDTDRRHDLRLMLMRNVLENLQSAVIGYLNAAEDRLKDANGQKLHS